MIKTDELIKIINNTKNKESFTYYISYITSKIRKNKARLKEIANKINYMGQLYSFSNVSKLERILLYLLRKHKKMYSIFRKKYDKIFKTELKRIYAEIDIQTIIVYGKVEKSKLYNFANFKGKKILYLNDSSQFSTKLNKKAYLKYDYILVSDDETLNKAKNYCLENTNIAKVNRINSLNDIEKYII